MMQQRMDINPLANDAATHHPVKPGLKKANTRSNRVFGQDLTNQSRPGSANQQRGKRVRAEAEQQVDLAHKKPKLVVVDEDRDVVIKEQSQSQSPARTRARARKSRSREVENEEEEEEKESARVVEDPISELRAWDQEDQADDLCCVDYIGDIMAMLKEQETHASLSLAVDDFMGFQKDINESMRALLVDWLVEVHRKFKLEPCTYFLAINILDRFLAKAQVGRKQLQLCGCACLWIASKYHEIYSPEIDDFVFISDNSFSEQQMVAMEISILREVNFVLTVPTLLNYIQRYSRISTHYLKKEREMKIISHLISYCAEHCVLNYKLCRRRPSELGAVCFVFACLATKVFTVAQYEKDELEKVTGYSLQELRPPMRVLNEVLRGISKKAKTSSILKKYSHAKFSQIGKLNFHKLKTAFLKE